MADLSDEERGHLVVVEGIKKIYRDVVRPIEQATKFEHFHSNMVTARSPVHTANELCVRTKRGLRGRAA